MYVINVKARTKSKQTHVAPVGIGPALWLFLRANITVRHPDGGYAQAINPFYINTPTLYRTNIATTVKEQCTVITSWMPTNTVLLAFALDDFLVLDPGVVDRAKEDKRNGSTTAADRAP
ncbi:hypothetical protein AG1IA_04605 [Rhizoctonia solani AG-1 IA]|uniref:Uncharacterized protein n=1 Tax=Thanatephorus cucumeris (strain AG1-IA) TaxID=983506 RepID=L8WX21_THACA|nr:hypothetical protein AG1IA_04605 [Rhizoctonia solani AG-1 IA]